jgi:hypothetical protein
VASEVNRTDPLMLIYRYRLAAADLITIFAFATLCWAGLRTRRQVQLHARYLLVTVLFLIMPIATRLFSGLMPGLTIRGPEDFGRYGLSFHISGLIALVIALRLYLGDRPHGRPFLVAMGALVFQSIAFEWIARTEAWIALMKAYGALPASILIGAGLALGLAVVVLGWSGAPARPRPADPLPTAAV